LGKVGKFQLPLVTLPPSLSALLVSAAAEEAAGADEITEAEAARAEREDARVRALHFALIDEADSVLIDEARTPLVIARERADPEAIASP
jgi:hypothetical protein